MSISHHQSPTTGPDATEPFQRFFLQRLAQMTETITATSSRDAVIHLPITLLVDGQLLAGDLISYSEYLKKSMRSIESVFQHAIKQAGASLPTVLSSIDEEIRRIEGSNPNPPRGYLWLKNVRGSWIAAKDPVVPEHVVEIAIDRISVFWMGHAV